jgi:hypothetical protein
MRISDGRLPTAAAIFVLLDAFVALVDALAAERLVGRQLRAQLAEHALTLIAFVVEPRLLVFFGRQQRRSVGFDAGSERQQWGLGRPDVYQHAGRQLGRRQLRLAVGILGWFERRRQSR